MTLLRTIMLSWLVEMWCLFEFLWEQLCNLSKRTKPNEPNWKRISLRIMFAPFCTILTYLFEFIVLVNLKLIFFFTNIYFLHTYLFKSIPFFFRKDIFFDYLLNLFNLCKVNLKFTIAYVMRYPNTSIYVSTF
jgi:hypothetical protein